MNVLQRFPPFTSLIAVLLAAVGVVIITGQGASTTDAAAAQDVIGLDRRINMLEQRFYRIEQSISRLEQYAASQRPSGSSSADLRDREQMRQELQRLQLRLTEVECGLLRLDERTATTSGNRRSGDARTADPCRQNPGLPLRLPSRP